MDEEEQLIKVLKRLVKEFFVKETALIFAQFSKDMMDSLTEKGFSRAEALELVKIVLGSKGKG